MSWLQPISHGIGALGVLVIVLGVLLGAWRFAVAEWRAARGGIANLARHQLRESLGFYLLLGLEFLIAADIIETLMKPEPRELIALGAIVAIRTVISYSLNAELKQQAHDSNASRV
jgi:uncharacterized membrane protein